MGPPSFDVREFCKVLWEQSAQMESVVVPMFDLPIMRNNNVIMTVNESASQKRGSEYFS